ncbi:MAG: hypothetical protein ACRDK3_14080 [Actinomycetota bacterium]
MDLDLVAFFAVFLAVVFFAVFLAVVFFAVFLAVVFFAVFFFTVFLAVVFLGVCFAVFLAVLLLAVLREEDFLRAPDLLLAVLPVAGLRVGLRPFRVEDRWLVFLAAGSRPDDLRARVCLVVLLDDPEECAEAFRLPDFFLAGVMGAGR